MTHNLVCHVNPIMKGSYALVKSMVGPGQTKNLLKDSEMKHGGLSEQRAEHYLGHVGRTTAKTCPITTIKSKDDDERH